MPETTLNKDFLKFLSENGAAFKKFVDIVNEWRKMQGQAPAVVGNPNAPRSWVAGETHDLTAAGISLADLDAMEKGYAEAIVKEKAIQYIKGFIAGVMLVGG